MIILKRPIITEKSMRLASAGLYTFEVDKDATKPMVARAVKDKFNVSVLSVKVIRIKGQTKTQRTVRKNYKASDIKKALIKVGIGQKIAIFETPKEEVVVTTAEGEPIMLREKKDLLGRTKVKVERSPARNASQRVAGGAVGAAPTTQRKVITGK